VLVIFAILFALMHVAALILAPVLVGSAIDYIVAYNDVNLTRVLNYCIYLLITIIIAAVTSYLSTFLSTKLAQTIAKNIRIDTLAAINCAPIYKIDSLSKGELSQRLTTDCERIAEGIASTITQIFTFIALVIGTLIFMFRLNITMALVVALLTPLSIIAAVLIAKFSHKMLVRQTANEGAAAALGEEFINLSKTVKLYNYEEAAEDRLKKHTARIKDSGQKAVFSASLTAPTSRFINGLIFACVAVVGAYLVLGDSDFSIGMLSIFLAFAMQYARPFNEITNAMSEIQGSIVSAKRVFSINSECKMHDAQLRHADQNSNLEARLKGDIEFKNIDFGYDDNALVIKNFCLSIKAGQSVAIVGKTGSGKTTLINLLLKFYSANNGEILIDGTNIDSIDKQLLRQNIGLILQDSWVFKGSIFDNIAFSKHGTVTLEEVITAAKKAHLHDFISSLKHGYDTIIDTNTLSKGQMQLLSLARIFLTTPPIIILDEATSSLDARTDYLVQDALKNITKGHTSIIVAHRLSTIKGADLIVVLENGSLIEQGTHDELIAKQGSYCTLIKHS